MDGLSTGPGLGPFPGGFVMRLPFVGNGAIGPKIEARLMRIVFLRHAVERAAGTGGTRVHLSVKAAGHAGVSRNVSQQRRLRLVLMMFKGGAVIVRLVM